MNDSLTGVEFQPSVLSTVIREAKKQARLEKKDGCPMRLNLPDLAVLTKDPFRMNTCAHHDAAKWFALQVQRHLGDYGVIHLRGLHYRVVAVGDMLMPNGRPYINDDKCWTFLADEAAKAARWLEYVPFERIVDERNAPPERYIVAYEEPDSWIRGGYDLDLPDLNSLLHGLRLKGSHPGSPIA